MRVLAVKNFRDTPLGLVGEALDAAGAIVDLRRPHQGDALPADASAHDALVILGGGQNARDDAGYPYLPALCELALAFHAADKSVLGICLGAQILARAHGAENRLGLPVEFGWHDVTPTEAGRRDPVIGALGDGGPLFHWHEDSFALPAGAEHLATSAMTANQAFRIGRAGYGIQFHFEADTRLVRLWSEAFVPEIAAIDPDWPAHHAMLAPTLGATADSIGRALADAWIGTIR